MKINRAGLEIVKYYEKLHLRSYQDSGGVWTIGYGHTRGIGPNEEISRELAEKYLVEDLNNAEAHVLAYVSPPLNENQFSALVSLVFNIGAGNFRKSTLRYFLNRGRFAEAAEEFLRWKYDNGKPLKGLLERREEEMDLFLTPPPAPIPRP
jgi:lysozyme